MKKNRCYTCKHSYYNKKNGALCTEDCDDNYSGWEPIDSAVDTDTINHPAHYTLGRKYEVLDVIEDWKLDYHRGNAVKYIARAGIKNKDTEIEDLGKAIFYLNRLIQKLNM